MSKVGKFENSLRKSLKFKWYDFLILIVIISSFIIGILAIKNFQIEEVYLKLTNINLSSTSKDGIKIYSGEYEYKADKKRVILRENDIRLEGQRKRFFYYKDELREDPIMNSTAYTSIMTSMIFLLFWILLALKRAQYIKEDDDRAKIARKYTLGKVVKNLK